MADIDSKEASPRVFAPYQWAHAATNGIDVPCDVLMRFAEKVHSVTSGGETILKIAEVNSLEGELREEDDPKPYFNPHQMDSMLKLLRVSIEMLGGEAESLNDWAYEQRTTEGALESYHSAVNRLKCKGIPLPKN